MMDTKLRVCRKCLPPREGQEEFFERLEGYIRNLDESVKTDQETYEKRLAACSACSRQMNGMCRLCGCYVELRAAQKVRKCPDIPAKW